MKLSEEIIVEINYHKQKLKIEKNNANIIWHENKIETYESIFLEIIKLEQQIEKMKNCDNCKYIDIEMDWCEKIDCENSCEWELKE